MNHKRWIYQQQDKEKVEEISRMFGIFPLAAAVVYNRGIRSAEDIEIFIKKDVADFHDPFLMKDMNKAVKRVEKAIIQHENITVYGDYDVDGVTSTAVLVKYLRSRGASVEYYIPDRIEEGYGINKHALERIKENGTSLLITVDSGITAIEEIRYASQLGLCVIVTDHHECKDEIPVCCAVLNPKQADCQYPFKELAGVGVTFKLIQALEGRENSQVIVDTYCDIVCLGTIADVVPLLGENRLLANAGLSKMGNTSNIGLKSLIKISVLKDKKITTGMVGFMLAPRINAAGRIGSALKAVELFLTDSETVADEISAELNEENKNRQATEAQILQEALKFVEENYDLNQRKVIVLAGENWHHGVIGIVASRITDKFYRPSILIALDDGEGKGSGRSISGFNLFKALDGCRGDLIKFGGHELAAGLSIEKSKIADFSEHINEYAEYNLNEDDLIPRIKIDYEIGVQDINTGTIRQLQVLEPFGMGNANPVFCFSSAAITDIRTVGDDKHLKLALEKDGCFIDAIGFNMGEYAQSFIKGDIIDVACSLDINLYNGSEKVQLVMKDIKLTDNEMLEYEYLKSFDKYMRANSVHYEISSVSNANIKKWTGSLKDVFEQTTKGKAGLVLVNTLHGLRQIIAETRSCNTYDQNCSIHYNRISKNGMLDVLVCPIIADLDTERYDGIYIYDSCFDMNSYYQIAGTITNAVIMRDFFRFEWCKQVIEKIVPDRQDFVIIYQYIKTRSVNRIYSDNEFLLNRRIAKSYNMPMNFLKMKNCLDVFQELELLDYSIYDEKITIRLCESKGKKVNIEDSSKLADIRRIKDRVNEVSAILK